ncbi:MAG: thioesterase domain-containing protein [Umezawaea sp.]
MVLDRNVIEQALCSIWEDLLAVEVTPDDDFFELGGYSLLLVDVVAEARKQGITMSPNDVFDHKTPAGIAAALLPDGSAPAQAGDARESDPDFDVVWALGRSPVEVEEAPTLTTLVAEGEGAPVFCFHWGAGNVRFLRDIVETFRGARPVHGLESVGMWSRERPSLSIVEMAARYLREIRAVQPHGPYLLVGPCAGGRVAYEVARQLEEVGERVAVLALINAMPPGTNDLDASWGLRDFYDFRLASLRKQFDVPHLDADRDRVLRAMVETAKIDADMDPDDLHWRQAVWAAGNFAQEHYEPRPYGGHVTVFQLAQVADREDARWSRVAPDTEVHTVEAADTLPLLRHPAFAEILAKKLAQFPG